MHPKLLLKRLFSLSMPIRVLYRYFGHKIDWLCHFHIRYLWSILFGRRHNWSRHDLYSKLSKFKCNHFFQWRYRLSSSCTHWTLFIFFNFNITSCWLLPYSSMNSVNKSRKNKKKWRKMCNVIINKRFANFISIDISSIEKHLQIQRFLVCSLDYMRRTRAYLGLCHKGSRNYIRIFRCSCSENTEYPNTEHRNKHNIV